MEKLSDGEELYEAFENDPAYLEVGARTHAEGTHRHATHRLGDNINTALRYISLY